MKHPIDENLLTFESDYLYLMANWYEKQADIFRQRANDIVAHKNIDEKKIFSKYNDYKDIPKIMRKYLRQGMTLAEAYKATSKVANAPLGTVTKFWKDFTMNNTKLSMAHRDRLIIDLLCLGRTQKDIAGIIGMHPNSICRVIRKIKQRNEELIGMTKPETYQKALAYNKKHTGSYG